MNQIPIDPEEMALRQDLDFIASKEMIGEGAPSYDSFNHKEEHDSDDEERELPRTYQ